jgi:preprotein translocase subunit Sec61beta
MDWFSQKTSIAGIQIPNWVIVLGAAVIVILLITSMR